MSGASHSRLLLASVLIASQLMKGIFHPGRAFGTRRQASNPVRAKPLHIDWISKTCGSPDAYWEAVRPEWKSCCFCYLSEWSAMLESCVKKNKNDECPGMQDPPRMDDPSPLPSISTLIGSKSGDPCPRAGGGLSGPVPLSPSPAFFGNAAPW